MLRAEGERGLRVLRLRIFDVLRFVEHGGGEIDFAQCVDVASQQSVARYNHVHVRDRLETRGATGAFEHERLEFWSKLPRFILPVCHQRCRADDESRAIALVRAEKRERLHRFTKTHLVGQDAAEIVRRETREPFETDKLILAQYLCERAEFRLRIRRRVAAGDELLQCFATISDGGAKLTRGLFYVPGMGAVDAVKSGPRLRRIAIANDLLEILQTRGVDHREVAIL